MNRQNHIEPIIIKYLNGVISDNEHQELISWIKESDGNQMFFDQMREVWLASGMKNDKDRFDSHTAFERFRKKTVRTQPIPRFREKKSGRVVTLSYRWAAAVILLAIFGGVLLQRWVQIQATNQVETAYQEITVPYGARSKMLLPDGSRITLNAGTTLRYPTDFGTKNRDLWLDGEAYFVVNKSSTPFIVHSGDVQIKAVGTQFNVRAYSSENNIETTLVEGKVIVSNTRGQSNQYDEVTLLPNQKLIVSKKEEKPDIEISETVEWAENPARQSVLAVAGEMIKQEAVDPLPDISWKDNEWVIYRESLENLAVKLERRYDVKIVFNDEHLKSFRYNGTLPDESLEQVLKVMSIVSPIRYSVKGKIVVFSKNKQFKGFE